MGRESDVKGRYAASLVQVSFCVSWAGQGHSLSSFPPECHLRRLDPHPLQVTERGKAEAADLRPGDIIVSINGETAKDMLHAEAQSKIRQSPSPLRLRLDR